MDKRYSQNEELNEDDNLEENLNSHDMQDQRVPNLNLGENINNQIPENTEETEHSNTPNQNPNQNDYTQQNVENQSMNPSPQPLPLNQSLPINQNPEQKKDKQVFSIKIIQQNVESQTINPQPKKQIQTKRQEQKEENELNQSSLFDKFYPNTCNLELPQTDKAEDEEMKVEKKDMDEENQNDANTENIQEPHESQETPPQNENDSEMFEEINEDNNNANGLVQTLNNAEENMPLEEPEQINNETSTINTSEVSGNSNSISNYYQSAEENNNNNNNITIPIQSYNHVFSYESFMFNNSSIVPIFSAFIIKNSYGAYSYLNIEFLEVTIQPKVFLILIWFLLSIFKII